MKRHQRGFVLFTVLSVIAIVGGTTGALISVTQAQPQPSAFIDQ